MRSDAAEFEQRTAQFRPELVAYCYRMLGAALDAEDLVQETYLRAWRARAQYDESRASLRTWLYRIATNVCLTALESRSRRPLPAGFVSPRAADAPFEVGVDVTWLQPIPDAMLEQSDPVARAIDRSGLRLAFVAALQQLSAGQRGALILRDVLGFSASETAEILVLTVAAVNSSLQRARTGLKAARLGREQLLEPSDAEQRAWVDRYMEAFERADVEGLKQLLAYDVLMEMPPLLNWFTGLENYGMFMDWVFDVNGTDWRLVPVAANGQAAFAAYNRVDDEYRLHTLQIFTVTERGISRNSVFQDADIFASFDLPQTLA